MGGMKKHYPEIDKLRGIAIIMVILYHAVIVYPVDLREIYWCKVLRDFLWYMEMPLFFIVSGFCCSCQEGRTGAYLRKKAKRLLVPYFAFGLLEILPRIIPNPLVNEQMLPGEAFVDLFLYGGSNWFLWTLFVLSALYPVVQKLCRKGMLVKAGLLAAAFFLYLLSYRMTNLFLIQMCAWFFLYFLIGNLLRQFDYEKLKRAASNQAWPAVVGFMVMAAVFWQNCIRGENRMLIPFGVLGGLAFFWYAAVKSGRLSGSFLQLCGKYSLQLYLVGAYSLVASRTLLVSIGGLSGPALIILFNFIIDLLLTLWISRYIIERFRLLRFLSGMN